MKYRISRRLPALMMLGILIFMMGSCSNKARIESLEQWKTETEERLASLSSRLNQVGRADYVTDVKPLEDGSGYVISFKFSPDIRIENGKDGDMLFSEFDNSNPDYLYITLADGQKFQLQKYEEIYIRFKSNEPFVWTETNNTIDIVLSPFMKESNFMAVMAELTVIPQAGQVFLPGQEAGGWEVTLTEPAFQGGLYTNGSIKAVLTAPADKSISAMLKVTLLDKEGKEYSVTRIVKQEEEVITNNK